MSIIKRQVNQWLDKRIPASNQYRLNHKSIFIFPSKFGGLFLALCCLLFLLGTNYQNNLMLLLCYFLISIFLVNLLTSYINFARINLHLGKTPEVFLGDNLHFPIWLNANDNTLPPNGLVSFKFQTSGIKKSVNDNTEIDGNSYCNPINLNLVCTTRGKIKLSRVTVECFYPLGLYRCWTHLAFHHDIVVFPKPIPCDIILHAASQGSSDESVQVNHQSSGSDDFSHLKNYQLGEPLNHVAWKQLARGRGMVSKQFASEDNQIGWLRLDSYTASPSDLSATKRLEIQLSQLCFQVTELSRKEQIFGMELGQTRITPSSGNTHRLACLTALAVYKEH